MSSHDPSAPARPTSTEAEGGEKRPGLPAIDVNEYGGKKGNERQSMNRRLFMQLLVFDAPQGKDPGKVIDETLALLREANIEAVVYADLMQPRGIGLLTWSDDPAHFVTKVRPLFGKAPLVDVELRPDFAMVGRTYSFGYEPDLEHVLLKRSVLNVMNPALPWHVWYPLRRSGEFARLDAAEQSQMMREHAAIGMAYGQAELGHDIRLACHGLDADDNEFVIGLVGRELHPLSHLVQAMRKTRQTSEFITKMGPFFVGHVAGRTGPGAP